MNKLTKKLTVRFSEKEIQEIEDKAKVVGHNKSIFLRDIILKNKTKVIHKTDAIQIIYHHNKMGNNLNQIAYKLNTAFLAGKISEKLFEQNLKLLNDIKNEQRNIIDLLLYTKET